MKKEASPMRSVIRPSMRKSHCQPAQPRIPRMRRRPKARMEVTIVVVERAVQKKERRMGSSREV